MLFSVPDFLVCGEAAGGNQQEGCDPNGQTTSYLQLVLRQQHGHAPRRHGRPERDRLLVGPVPNTVGNCWYKNIPAKGATITQSPLVPPLPNCNDGKEPEQSQATGDPAQTGELLSCLASFESRQFDPNGPCPWFKVPPEPQPGQSSSPLPAARSAVFNNPFQDEVPVSADGAVDKRSDLSGVSCMQWNYAGDDGRAWLVKRIREFAGGQVNDGEHDIGAGNTLTDTQATDLFNDWCPRRYAQGFVLYKLYTYAAMAARAQQ